MNWLEKALANLFCYVGLHGCRPHWNRDWFWWMCTNCGEKYGQMEIGEARLRYDLRESDRSRLFEDDER